MKSILKSFALAACMFTLFPAQQTNAASAEPLMVIRFTTPDLNYRDSLGRAVRSAVAAKQNVAFDLVVGAQAAGYAGQVAQDIINMGIRPANVSLRGSNINNNEVLIFVR